MRVVRGSWFGAALGLSMVAAFLTPTAASATPDGGDLGATWTAAHDGPAEYPGVQIDWDRPITMSDGVVLRANVYRPADAGGRPVETPLPTILNMTPYTKLISNLADSALSIPVLSDFVLQLANSINLSGTPFSGITDLTRALSGGGLRTFTVDRKLIQSGYTQVVADVRDASTLTVAPGIASLCSRDSAQITIGVTAVVDGCGKDSTVNELNGLTFTSAPVAAPTEISGPVNVHLNTVLEATDGYWTATINDVAPDGQSTVLTSGQLTSSLRAVDDSQSQKSANGDYTDPYYPLTLDTRQPIVPGKPTALEVGLTATDAVLQPGHRLRVDVYAGNLPKGMLLRPLLDESELKPQHLVLDPNAPSFVNIPISQPVS